MSDNNHPTSVWFNLLLLFLLYSGLGLLGGLLYNFLLAPGMSMDTISIPVALGIFWLWAIFFAPPIMFFVGIFKAWHMPEHVE
jgi:hypothetical protein